MIAHMQHAKKTVTRPIHPAVSRATLGAIDSALEDNPITQQTAAHAAAPRPDGDAAETAGAIGAPLT